MHFKITHLRDGMLLVSASIYKPIETALSLTNFIFPIMTQTVSYALGAIVLIVLYNIMRKVGDLAYFLPCLLT